MGTLFLVRHAQASFGSDNYDQLSELGHRQSHRLGQYFAQKALRFDAVITGDLHRQVQTWEGIRDAGGLDTAHLVWPGLNEFDSDAVIACVHAGALQKPDSPEMYRHHFRLLRDGLRQWMNGVTSPVGMPSYEQFYLSVVGAIDHVRQNFTGNVLLISSGGPISTAVGHVLGTTPETTIELNMRIRNTAVTEFYFNPKRYALMTFNTLPHLDDARYAQWVSYV